MGLDAYSYSRVRRVLGEVGRGILAKEEPREEAYDLGYKMPYVDPWFASRAAPIETGGIYEILGEAGPTWSSSYSGYSQWREQLALFAGVKDLQKFWNLCAKMEESGAVPRGVPFWQLIHFSDCEGTIGSETVAALARDFEAHRDQAREWAIREFGTEESRFWSGYQRWWAMFEHAVDDGMVEFR